MEISIKSDDRHEKTSLKVERGLVSKSIKISVVYDDGSGVSVTVRAKDVADALRAFQ